MVLFLFGHVCQHDKKLYLFDEVKLFARPLALTTPTNVKVNRPTFNARDQLYKAFLSGAPKTMM
ncbi:hypothetical protein [Ammoniphilus sp. CFH 90114]|uniref:hypothetical protein n=1 Tax=Ammoniphilus sp. CFH 90114 TaxID=2493665 RepID=UPI00100E4E50|nr:hypothetical protein [Ammoniphilus sp. CFH 90114]RXT01952.1 hypothetical protein EIZ39_25275 [Ammoniphilus sp. CFH 90114]